MSNLYYGEEGYISLLKNVLENGVKIPDRTGVGCQAIFGATLIYDKLPNGRTDYALSTIRPCPLRMAFEEFMFFLRGQTDTKILEEKGIYFWSGNTTREFLDNRNMRWAETGSMGAAYSSQWRRAGLFSGAESDGWVDQLAKLLDTMKHDRYSRRMVVDLWNPVEEYAMPITPCWMASQYVVIPDENGDDTLHVSLINRSLDALFGAPYALQQYRLFQLMLCKMFGFKMGQLRASLSHVHLYNNQIEYTEELLTRDYGQAGQVSISRILDTIDDLLALEWSDIIVDGLVVNKEPFVTPRPPMSA